MKRPSDFVGVVRDALPCAAAGLVFGVALCARLGAMITAGSGAIVSHAWMADRGWLQQLAAAPGVLVNLRTTGTVVACLMFVLMAVARTGVLPLWRALQTGDGATAPRAGRVLGGLLLTGAVVGVALDLICGWNVSTPTMRWMKDYLVGSISSFAALGFLLVQWVRVRGGTVRMPRLTVPTSKALTRWAVASLLTGTGVGLVSASLLTCSEPFWEWLDINVYTPALTTPALGVVALVLAGSGLIGLSLGALMTLFTSKPRIPAALSVASLSLAVVAAGHAAVLDQVGITAARQPLHLVAAQCAPDDVVALTSDGVLPVLPLAPTQTFYTGANLSLLRRECHTPVQRYVLNRALLNSEVLQWNLGPALKLEMDRSRWSDPILSTRLLMSLALSMPATPDACAIADNLADTTQFDATDAAGDMRLATLFEHQGRRAEAGRMRARAFALDPAATNRYTADATRQVVVGSVLRGRLTENGQPLAGVRVRLVHQPYYNLAREQELLGNLQCAVRDEVTLASVSPLPDAKRWYGFGCLETLAVQPVTITRADGSFEVDSLDPGSYLVAVRVPASSVHHAAHTPGRVVIDAAHPLADLGTIDLTP